MKKNLNLFLPIFLLLFLVILLISCVRSGESTSKSLPDKLEGKGNPFNKTETSQQDSPLDQDVYEMQPDENLPEIMPDTNDNDGDSIPQEIEKPEIYEREDSSPREEETIIREKNDEPDRDIPSTFEEPDTDRDRPSDQDKPEEPNDEILEKPMDDSIPDFPIENEE